MAFLLTCVLKDLRRRLADPVALVLWLAIPLFVGGLMVLVFGRQASAPPKATVLLVDEDDSVIGRLIGRASQSGNVSFLDIQRVTRDEGTARMNAGEATAMVVLPRGFGEAVLNSAPTSVSLVRNPAQVILPGIVQTGLEMLIELITYAQRLLAGPLAQVLAERPDQRGFLADESVALFGGALNERLRGVATWLFPPALSVEFVDTRPKPETAAEGLNLGALFLPSMMFMALLFVAQGMADDVWDEKDAGTLRRAVALPHPLGVFLGGKLVAAAAIMTAVGLVGLGVLAAMGAVTLARIPVALAWMVFGGTALYCYFLVLQFFASTRRGASVLGNIVLFPMMMIGGSFFPFEAMPEWMAAVGQWTPNGQALARFKDLIAGTAAPDALAMAAAAIGAPAALAFLLSARFVGGRFATRA